MSNEHYHDDMPMPMSPPSMNMDDMPMMHMTFYWGKNAIVLFQGWPNHSLGMYILAISFVFSIAFGVEILSVFSAPKPSRVAAGGLAQTGVYALKTALAYLVMLSVMSFNLGIFIAAVAGHGFGFFCAKVLAQSAASRAEPRVEAGSKV